MTKTEKRRLIKKMIKHYDVIYQYIENNICSFTTCPICVDYCRNCLLTKLGQKTCEDNKIIKFDIINTGVITTKKPGVWRRYSVTAKDSIGDLRFDVKHNRIDGALV